LRFEVQPIEVQPALIRKGKAFCERAFALHRQKPENDKQIFDVASPLEKILRTSMDELISI